MKKYLSDCKSCVFSGKVRVRGGGNPLSKIIFIGQCPGSHEAATGRVFANPQGAGGRLNRMFGDLCIPREDIWLTNTIKCVLPVGAIVPEEAIRSCWPNLQEELENKELIVTLGRVAEEAIKSRVGSGGLFEPRRIFFHATHPAAACRKGIYEAKLRAETIELKAILDRFLEKS